MDNRPRVRPKVPEYGSIGSVVKTEWGYLFNICQRPS